MKNLIVTIALILCIFGIFMVKLNYEASTIPEVEEWIYYTPYIGVHDEWFISDIEARDYIYTPSPYEAMILLRVNPLIEDGWEGSVILRIITEEQDTINITREMVELFEKLFVPQGE